MAERCGPEFDPSRNAGTPASTDEQSEEERRVLDAIAREEDLTDEQVDAIRSLLGPAEPLSDEEVDELLDQVTRRRR
jgi:hypothetical protein